MSKFKIVWTSGKATTVETSEALTPDAYAMERWGMESAAQVLVEYGTSIELVEDDGIMPVTEARKLGEDDPDGWEAAQLQLALAEREEAAKLAATK